jgi:flagellar biosynthesis/type III secretory pathway protein FliH
MGIITKEQADDVTAFSFAEGQSGAVEPSNWNVLAEPNPALPPVAAEAKGLSGNAGAGDVGDDGLDLQTGVGEIPAIEAPPPIFEIPEEVLGGFYEQVVMAGLEDGKNQVLAELSILQERFGSALDALASVSRELASQNQIQIITLACQIAERLVRDELQIRPERLLRLIADALSQQDTKDAVIVRCSAGDYEYISANRPELEDGVGAAFQVRIELDETLEYGDFQMESRKGQIDGRIQTRIDEVEKTLGNAHDV